MVLYKFGSKLKFKWKFKKGRSVKEVYTCKSMPIWVFFISWRIGGSGRNMKAPGKGLQSTSLALHWKWQLCKLAPLTVAFVVFLIRLLLPFLCKCLTCSLRPLLTLLTVKLYYKIQKLNFTTIIDYSVSFFFLFLVFLFTNMVMI